MTEDETVQAIYEGMHDAMCINHGPHCADIAPQFRDAIRVGLQRAQLDGQAVDDPEKQQLRAQVARVRGVVADMHGTTGARHWARWLDSVLNAADDPNQPARDR